MEETKKSNAKKTSTKKTNTKTTTKKKVNNETVPAKVKKTTTTKEKTTQTPKKTPRKKSDITLEEADSFYHVSLLAQAVCVIGILAISILAIFEHSFTVPIEVLVGITLLIMAYNNEKLFKRKGLTIVYVIFGIISLIVGILGYFGVTV